MATLLDALWALGVRTSHSCEGTPGIPSDDNISAAYVAFPVAGDALSFFETTLRSASTAEHMARIDVSVRFFARPTPLGVDLSARGRAVTLELSADSTQESGLKGCVRFNSELVEVLEVALRRTASSSDGRCG